MNPARGVVQGVFQMRRGRSSTDRFEKERRASEIVPRGRSRREAARRLLGGGSPCSWDGRRTPYADDGHRSR